MRATRGARRATSTTSYRRGSALLEAGDFAAAAIPLERARSHRARQDLDPRGARPRVLPLGPLRRRARGVRGGRRALPGQRLRPLLPRPGAREDRPPRGRPAATWRWPPGCAPTAPTTACTGTGWRRRGGGWARRGGRPSNKGAASAVAFRRRRVRGAEGRCTTSATSVWRGRGGSSPRVRVHKREPVRSGGTCGELCRLGRSVNAPRLESRRVAEVVHTTRDGRREAAGGAASSCGANLAQRS